MSRRVAERALVTGGAGFIGSNLADRLACEGCRVTLLDNLARPGVRRNLDWLVARHGEQITFVRGDVGDGPTVVGAVADAYVVFHLAAQVAVTTSLVDPADDLRTNLLGTFQVLEAARPRRTPVVFASTNKVYGDLADVALSPAPGDDGYLPTDPDLRAHGVAETRPLDFHTPYGCSKGAADQYVLDYARSFDLPTCVLRMSCIYGPRQMGTEDQGWVAHFLISALAGRPISVFGDGWQVRDILHVDDVVDAYLGAWRRIGQAQGQAFNIGGGPANAVSLRQVLAEVEALAQRPLDLTFAPWRQGDQRYFVADHRKARAVLGLPAPRAWRDGIADLAAWLQSQDASGLITGRAA